MIITDSTHIITNYDAVIEECRSSGRPIYLTKNGHIDSVIMDIASFRRREQSLDTQRLVLESYIDNLRGISTYTSDEVRFMMNRVLKRD